MRKILVDANVLISFLTDRNEEQRKKASALFRGAAERAHGLVLHTISIFEMVYVLTQLYDQEPSEVAQDVAALFSMPGVLPIEEISWPQVLERWPGAFPSLGDAVLAAVAREGRYDAVATFDVDLRKRLIQQGSAAYWLD